MDYMGEYDRATWTLSLQFSVVIFTEIAQRIFKRLDMQNTNFIPDKELSLKIFIYGKHLYVVKYESYKF